MRSGSHGERSPSRLRGSWIQGAGRQGAQCFHPYKRRTLVDCLASFAEAFFFNVQTLGSIGYGVLHPVALYANLLVTAESLCGLLFVAITTKRV